MAKSSSSDLTSMSRKTSSSISKNLSVKQSSKLKIAHRTRSKCPISEKTLSEIEAELPDDLLFDNQNTKDVSHMIQNSNNHLSLSNINDSLATSASTPISINDPNDDLWFEFLNSLHEPKLQDTSLNSKTNTSLNKLDNDDANEDPDFTVCLESCDFEGPDYLDDWFQVPRKEAIALVKDAIEFCDNIPIAYEDQRTRDKLPIKSTSSEKNNNTLNINNNKPIESFNASTENQQPIVIEESTNVILNSEYIPQFTDIQRKQLDEQLRNHVQLLTQSYIACYNSTEFKQISNDSLNLLNVLNNLNKNSNLESTENVENINNALLSPSFEIINLKDSLNLIENIKTMELSEWDLKNGLPTKILEIFVDSRVFYNTNLIPANKYKYSSQFTRSSFTDCEKILLIMGFNQFKRLPKDECCQCIKDFLLPQRSCHDIKKQLSNISNSEQRQANLKELIRRQKSINLSSIENFDFKKEIHYKSPLERIDRVQLPSIYTIAVERLKMANILKETRNYMNQSACSSTTNDESIQKSKNNRNKTKSTTTENIVHQQKEQNHQINRQNNEINQGPSSNNNTIISSNEKSNQSVLNDTNTENDISIIEETPAPKRTKINNPTEKIVINSRTNEIPPAKKAITNQKPIENVMQTIPTNALLNLISNRQQQQPQQTIIIDNNGRIITSPLFSAISASPQQFFLPQNSQMQFQTQQSQLPLVLPNNFSGTILYHPTIHIHTNGKNFVDQNKYKKLAPKK